MQAMSIYHFPKTEGCGESHNTAFPLWEAVYNFERVETKATCLLVDCLLKAAWAAMAAAG